MVSYEVPKPPQGFFSRMKDGVRLAAAFVKGDRDTISDITSTTVFSPLQPIKPMVPEIRGRTWDYQPGVNIQFQPRGYDSGRIPFKTLRAFARNCELLRLGIQTVKDQVSSFNWQIVPTEDSTLKADDALIKEMTAFFRKPDKVHTFDQWIRTMTEAYIVTDAISIYRAKDRIGRPYAFELMDGACYSEDTEVLTKRGWLRFADTNENDEFATRNQVTKEFQWQKSTYRHIRDYVGKMYHFHSRAVDLLVSPNHRMLVDRLPRSLGGSCHNSKQEHILSAQQLVENYKWGIKIPMSSRWSGVDVGEQVFRTQDVRSGTLRMSGDDYCSFMGMWLAEGSRWKKGACITQLPKGRGFAPYKALLDKVFGRDVCHTGTNFIVCSTGLRQHLDQFGHALTKFVPEDIMNATPRQLKLFWDHFWLGDGDSGRNRIYTSSKRMADQLVEIAQKMGCSASIIIRDQSVKKAINGREIFSDNPSYVVSVRTTQAMTFNVSEQVYGGKIYCVSVPNEILYVRRNGKPAWCGNTIKPLVDEDGRRPLPPDPAYQQVIKGAPRAMYDMNELLYMPRDILEHDPLYGYPIVEQIIVTAQTAIERAKFQLAYFTEGSLPDSYAALPKEMTADQIKAFEERFNNMMKGNTAGRREVPFFPEGTTIASLKQPPLKDDFDEWLARIIAYALGISPTALIKQMNRSTSEADQQRNEEEGQAPKLQHFKNVIDELLPDFGQTDEEKKFIIANVEFKWRDNNEIDADKQSQIEDRALRNGSKTINEVKLARGEDPIEGGDVPMVLTSGGYVPLDSFERNQAMQQQAIDAQPKPGEPGAGDEEDDAEKSAYGRVRKGGRANPAIPFPVHTCKGSCGK